MAQYRFSSQIIGRATGRSAVAAAAYRAGASLADERTGQIHDFSRKGGVLHTEIMAPDDAPEWMHDRQRLWNAVEIAEKRKDAQLSREVQLSLPHELTDEQRLGLVRDFVSSQFVAHGMIADVAIHAPGREGDDRNHHAHVMLTMRELTGEGFGNKARDWNSPELLQTWREEWALHQNAVLEKHGHPSRVDHRSFEVQGIDREPTKHLGAHAHQMEQRGAESRLGNENRAVDERNQSRANNHQEAVVVLLDIERHRRQTAKTTLERVAALEHVHVLAKIDQDRHFDRQRQALALSLDRQYLRSERTIAAELSAIEERQKATGWRRALRVVTGSDARDKMQAQGFRDTMADIATRRSEAMGALTIRQTVERVAIAKHEADQVTKLKADLAGAAAKKEKQILAEQRQAAWQAKREREKAERAQNTPKPVYRRNVTLDPQQQAKGVERKERFQPPKIKPPARENPIVKGDFEKARQINPPIARPAPTKTVFVSSPAPVPSPMGEVKAPVRQAREVPVQSMPKPAQKAPAAPQRDFKVKAMPSPAKPAPAPMKRDWPAAKTAPAPTTPAPTTPAAPAPRRDWQAAAKADMPRPIKPLPPRDPNKTRDRDR